MKNEQFKFAPITRSIIGCAMAVHNQLGNGFQELIYHRALAIEMTKQGLKFQDDVEVVIFYDCISIGKRRVDFLVESLIPVEIKAVKELDNVHLAQAINYTGSLQDGSRATYQFWLHTSPVSSNPQTQTGIEPMF